GSGPPAPDEGRTFPEGRNGRGRPSSSSLGRLGGLGGGIRRRFLGGPRGLLGLARTLQLGSLRRRDDDRLRGRRAADPGDRAELVRLAGGDLGRRTPPALKQRLHRRR